MKIIELDFFAKAESGVMLVPVFLESIDEDALAAIKKFFESHPDDLKEEYKDSGINPLVAPLAYFKFELREPEHTDIRVIVNNERKITLDTFNKWLKEEQKES